jgi:SAM-dependent methyltransferase
VQVVDQIHGAFVHTRRVRWLAQQLAPLMPRDGAVLDVGCGDGALASAIAMQRPDISVTGLETLPRDPCLITVEPFDGEIIPRQDNAADTVLFVDVLHHTHDPVRLLSEALRVARRSVVIKDHNRNGLFAEATLRFMDRVGNARHGVALPYNYWSREQWVSAFEQLGCETLTYQPRPKLYAWPASAIFGRSLHFIAELAVPAA